MGKGNYWRLLGTPEVPKRERIVSARTEALARRIAKPTQLPWRTTRDAIADLPDPTSPDTARVLNHRLQLGARSYPGHTGSVLDEPAKTLKAGVHGVPGGENMIALPNGKVRYLTVRESARLQTFPDDYKFHGSWTETMRQLGNAVPVALAQKVATSIREHLDTTRE